jgi:hypothetical protein
MNDENIIHCYTRAEAIADGVLVDVSEMAREARFRYPVALTSTVWNTYVEVPAGVECQDEIGRLWDILCMLRYVVERSAGARTIRFQLHVRNDNRHGLPPAVELKAVCGPNDDGSPCITVMMPAED